VNFKEVYTMASQKQSEYAGIWHSAYWYPSNRNKGEDISEHYAEAHQRGNKLTIQSLRTQDGSYMIINLTLDGDLATGTWQEHTSPTGEFKGAIYSGAMQLLISEDKNRMEGRWVGVGQEKGKRYIYGGRWELVRAGSKNSADIEHAASTRTR
jgi:hypothetical protein